MKRNLISVFLLICLTAAVNAQWAILNDNMLPGTDTATPKIIFITDDNDDDTNVNFLKRQGFDVTKMWFPGGLGAATEDTIDMLNAADLVIIGRSGSSSRFRDSADKAAWNGLTSPQLLICPWKARWKRLNWFSWASTVSIIRPIETYDGFVMDPDDPIFEGITLNADSSLVWSYMYDDYIIEKQPSNGTWLVNRGDTVPLLVRFKPNIPFYSGATDSAAGPRTYFGMGNDATLPANYFPLTREAKKVYLAEICRMMDVPVPEIIYGAPDFSITVVTDDDYDKPCITFLQKQGFRIKTFWPENGLGAVGQDTIDMLNAEDLVIIGGSGSSTNFKETADKGAWNGLTSPLILHCPWKARPTRLNWFYYATFNSFPQWEGITTATAVNPDDPVFSFAPGIESDGHIPEWSFNPDYFFRTSPTFINGEQVVNRGDTIPLVVRFKKNVPFYTNATDSPAGERVYFGMGTDAGGPANFFPLTKTGEAIYFAETLRLLGAPAYEPLYLDLDRTLSALSVEGFTLDPAFNEDILHYTITVPVGTDSVFVTAIANSTAAIVYYTGWRRISSIPYANILSVSCFAENGSWLSYYITANWKETGIEESIKSIDCYNIFPNPVKDKLTISSTDIINNVSVYNLQGAAIVTRVVNSRSVELPVGSLNTGIYFIKVQSGNNIYIRKITKE